MEDIPPSRIRSTQKSITASVLMTKIPTANTMNIIATSTRVFMVPSQSKQKRHHRFVQNIVPCREPPSKNLKPHAMIDFSPSDRQLPLEYGSDITTLALPREVLHLNFSYLDKHYSLSRYQLCLAPVQRHRQVLH